MRAWNGALIALVVSVSATGCKFTTCSSDDEDCATGSLFDGGEGGEGGTDAAGGASEGGADSAGGSNEGGADTAGGSSTGGTDSGGSSGESGVDSAGASGEGGAGGFGGSNEGGAAAMVGEGGAGGSGELMCDPDDPALTACNACIQQVCCTEVLGCSDDAACSGDYEDDAMATKDSEISCVIDQNAYLADEDNADASDPDDPVLGYAGQESVDGAIMLCESDFDAPLSDATKELVECILHTTAGTDEPEFGDCATACFGVEF